LNKIVPCSYPWNHVFVDTQGSLLTCCYAGEPIGNLNNDDFFSIWNGEEYRELRSSLVEGRVHRRCRNCFKFSPSNVDDLRAHITLRSGAQAEIFERLGLENKF
jgi:radical SAM protein with 4Fe4S-binding SPASM domain